MTTVAILGTGFGLHHAKCYAEMPNVQVKWLWGRDAAKLATAKDELHIDTTQDMEAILRDEAVDLIDICLPTAVHEHYALEALRHGKHVLCETPAAPDADAALRIAAAAKAASLHVYVNQFMKFSAPHRMAAELIEQGMLGDIRAVTASNQTSPRWGALGLHKTVEAFHMHLLDYVTGLFGLPEGIVASGVGGEDEAALTSLHKYAGTLCTLQSMTGLAAHIPFRLSLEITGTRGIFLHQATYGEDAKEETLWFHEDGRCESLHPIEVDETEAALAHIIDCVRMNAQSPIVDIGKAALALSCAESIVAQI